MTASSDATPASGLAGLCAACGMCCDGSMFYAVELQPGDARKQLLSLGLRLKSKGGQTLFNQPCTAFRETHCAIYEHRPTRCRLFNCQQITRFQAGEISELQALEKIHEARERVAKVRRLLVAAGSTNRNRPLAGRYKLAIAQPIDEASESEEAAIRRELITEMEELEALLIAHFRVPPSVEAQI